uniref:Reverse transcriptase domain-containing protein n=1 Tax=Megaselia scalaris TaxID=36166 RepID=T1GE80_MEGSC
MWFHAWKINTTNIIFNKSNQKLVYADDIDFIGRTITEVFKGLENEAKSRGLYVIAEKTKYMLSNRNYANHNALGPNVNIGSHNIGVVRNSIYQRRSETKDFLANRCLYRLLGSKQLSRKTKYNASITLIRILWIKRIGSCASRLGILPEGSLLQKSTETNPRIYATMNVSFNAHLFLVMNCSEKCFPKCPSSKQKKLNESIYPFNGLNKFPPTSVNKAIIQKKREFVHPFISL